MIPWRTLLTATLLGAVVATISGCSTVPQEPAKAVPAAQQHSSPTPKRIVLPANPRVYFFGDSWTKGASADPGRGFPHVVGETLGWQVELGPDNSGAGYVHTFDTNHALFPEAAQALEPFDADLIVLEGGLNDGPGPLTHFWPRVAKTITTLRKKAGGAPLVLVGPASPDGTVPEGLSAIDYEQAGVAKQLGIHYISPVKERWLTPTNVPGLVDASSFHPNIAGHAYYGGRLAADLQRFVTTRAAETAQ